MFKHTIFLVILYCSISFSQSSLSPTDVLNGSSKYNYKLVTNVVGEVQEFKQITSSISQFILKGLDDNYLMVRVINVPWLPNGKKVNVSGTFYSDFGYDGDEQLLNIIIVDSRNYGHSVTFK